MADPQDVDTLFPPKAADVDTLFPPEIEQQRQKLATPSSSPIHDAIFGNSDIEPKARILDQFGQGFKQAWGTEPLGLSDETQDYLRKSGWFNDYKNGHVTIGKAANEVLFRPAAAALDAGWRTVSGVFSGGQAAVAQFGAEVGQPELGREIAALPEAFPHPSFLGIPHPPIMTMAELSKARALGVIGAGEDGWKGVAEVPKAEEAATKAELPAEEAPITGQPAEPTPQLGQPTQAAPPDIHAVARQIDPETFQQYDALQTRQQTFRRWIDELRETRDQQAEANAPHVQEIQDTIAKINDPDTTPRLRKKYQARLDGMAEDYNNFIDEATAKDSPDMAKIRQRIQETDYAMRDLAPNVGKAYQAAREQMPPEPVVEPQAAPVEAPTETPIEAQQAIPAEATEQPAEAKQSEVEAPPIAPVKPIIDDVAEKLVAAGRPTEEAQAAAQIVSAYWQTRAARFKGAKGTAEEMYAREAPDVVGPKAVPLPEKAGALSFAQIKRGRIRLRDDAQNTITLLKDANASTFLHESAHDWLERMMADADDEQAPADLKADAETVRKWLGADKSEDIKTRQHEKFARGFETYMMEGTAPSQALANVFAKFKAWLTQIYQTVKNLKAPINDDIRDVFDRLLSVNPEKTVIAPERELPKSFADEHEALAETAKPEQAHDTAEKIQSERDRVAAEHIPEDQDARLEGIAAKASRREPGGTEPDSSVAATEQPGESGVNAEPRTVSEGGSETPQEGPRPSGPRKVSEIPETAATQFPKDESPLVDKAGNFRMENINAPEDVKQAIRDSVARNNEFMEQRRGVISDAEALSLAETMGMSADELNLRQIGEAFNKEQIVKLEKLFIQSATAARDAAKAAAEVGTDEAYMAYAEAESRQAMILDTVAGHAAGVRAEAGRALQAYNALKNLPGYQEAHAVADILKEATGKTLYQIKSRAAAVAALETPAQVAGAIRDMNKPGLGAMALEVFKNWLISGPITHATYGIGNATLAIFKATFETLGEAAVSQIREVITKSPEGRVYYGEVGAQLYAMLKGQRDGWKAAADSFRVGQTMPLPHEMLDTLTERQRVKYDAAIASGKTYEQAMSDLGVQTDVSTPFTMTTAVPNFTVAGVPVPLGSIVRVPGERMVAPIHSYFRTIGYIQSVARQAYRAAVDDGLSGDAFNHRIAELTRSPTEDMMETARNEATQQTLMGKGGDLTKKVSSLMNWQPNLPVLGPTKPLSFIDPFVHIASNIMEQAVLERGPLGVLAEKIRSDIAGKNGIEAQNSAISRMALGTSLSVVGIGMAAEGMITSSAPPDPKEAAMWHMVNGMAHSFRIGDLSFDLSRLGVLGFQMGIAADLHRFVAAIGKEDAGKLASLLVHSFAQNFLDEGFMRGPSDLIKALDDNDRYGASYMRNLVSSFAVPFSVGMSQIARQVDPFSRQARTLMDEIKSKIPFESETLMPRRDIWGEPVLNRTYAGVYLQRLQQDPVNKALMDLKIFPAPVGRKIRGVELTDQQYDQYSMIAGRTAKMRLNAIVSQPGFSLAPAGIKTEIINDAIKTARESARDLIMMRSAGSQGDDNIVRKAMDAKTVKRTLGKTATP